MNRGYIKFWRKAESSVSWTRGLEHRGMMITILERAAWKQCFEFGLQVQPGEFFVKVVAWAETLGMSTTSVRRILQNLVEDGFISISNMANRFTKITVLNWHIYQQDKEASWRADGEQAVNIRLTSGEQTASPLYKEEEGKNKAQQSSLRSDCSTEPQAAPAAPPHSSQQIAPELQEVFISLPLNTGKERSVSYGEIEFCQDL